MRWFLINLSKDTQIHVITIFSFNQEFSADRVLIWFTSCKRAVFLTDAFPYQTACLCFSQGSVGCPPASEIWNQCLEAPAATAECEDADKISEMSEIFLILNWI